jgi:hypothetical protein
VAERGPTAYMYGRLEDGGTGEVCVWRLNPTLLGTMAVSLDDVDYSLLMLQGRASIARASCGQ